MEVLHSRTSFFRPRPHSTKKHKSSHEKWKSFIHELLSFVLDRIPRALTIIPRNVLRKIYL
eukprot:EC718355.1.p2 GENE.EC718355.1~~EC718355.1.p2  ORF type:complete len:61 (-),score=8.93 EC718355.1:70-252(-)